MTEVPKTETNKQKNRMKRIELKIKKRFEDHLRSSRNITKGGS